MRAKSNFCFFLIRLPHEKLILGLNLVIRVIYADLTIFVTLRFFIYLWPTEIKQGITYVLTFYVFYNNYYTSKVKYIV